MVFLVDTLRADHLELYGHSRPTAPRLTRIAEQGLVFEQAMSTSSWTKPSVTSVFTSLFPGEHRVQMAQDRLPAHVSTLAELFQASGYRTAAFGANGWVFGTEFGLSRGFDDFEFVLNPDRAPDVRADLIVERAMEWLGEGEEPFFLYVHTIDPHAPYDPPAEERERFTKESYAGPFDGSLEGDRSPYVTPRESIREEDVAHMRALYEAEIAFGDTQMGRLVDRLEELGLWEETTFVFTSDHGEEFRDHDRWGHGGTLFEEVIHVPLVIKPPASRFQEPRRFPAPVSLIDVAPTVCELAGVDWRNSTFAGLPLLRPPADERLLISELRFPEAHEIVIRSGPLKYKAKFGARLIESAYRVDSDPKERAPLALDNTASVDRLRKTAEQHHKMASESGLMIEFVGDGGEHEVELEILCGTSEPGYGLFEVERSGDKVHVTERSDGRVSVRGSFVLQADELRDILVWKDPQPIQIRLTIDGVEPRYDAVQLGPSGTNPASFPFLVRPDDPRLRTEAFVPTRPDEGVLCRIWYSPPAETEIGPEVQAALMALGYLGDH